MIKLIKSTFFQEKKTKLALTEFIAEADILSMGRYDDAPGLLHT